MCSYFKSFLSFYKIKKSTKYSSNETEKYITSPYKKLKILEAQVTKYLSDPKTILELYTLINSLAVLIFSN